MSDADQAEERWAVCRSFPAYSVSTYGRIRRDALVYGGGGSLRVPKGFLKQRPLPMGHCQVTLSIGNKPRTVLVHRLVAEAFLPPPRAEQDCVLHRDDNPSNNRWDNLFWGTRLDNNKDMVGKGRQARGSRMGTAKLSDDEIRSIRNCVKAGQKQRDVAKRFGVSQSSVSLIALGRTWAHVK